MQFVVRVVSALNYDSHYATSLKCFLGEMKLFADRRNVKFKNALDLFVCITDRSFVSNSTVIVTNYKGESICSSAAFISDWNNPTGAAKQAFFDQVCDVRFSLLQECSEFILCDLRPENIVVQADEQSNHELTVIAWDASEFQSGFWNIQDNVNPFTDFDDDVDDACGLVYVAYSVCQLLLYIYILHRVAKCRNVEERCQKARHMWSTSCDAASRCSRQSRSFSCRSARNDQKPRRSCRNWTTCRA